MAWVRWPIAMCAALVVLFLGATCVDRASRVFLDPFWNAPLEEPRG